MSLSRLGNRGRPGDFTWPGFVDALASLLMVFVFVLMVFVIIQANLSFRISGQDTRISALQDELLELGELLNIERQSTSKLSTELSQARLQISSLIDNNQLLQSEIATLQSDLLDKESEITAQQADIKSFSSQIIELEANLQQTNSLAETRLGEIKDLISRLAASQKAYEAQADSLEKMENEYNQSLAQIMKQDKTITKLGVELTELADQNLLSEAELAEKQRLLLIAEQALLEKIKALNTANNTSKEAKAEIERLLANTTALKEELQKLNSLLADKERQSINDKITIADLGKKLNSALASRVQELQKFRSEFFGQLSQVLKDRTEVRVVGDRFIFQSEVLFAAGRADISNAGKEQLAKIASAIEEIENTIPENIPWVLQIEGHTDSDPIAENPYFRDNWDLSTERALSVVRFLRSQGIPANRLAATGYGEFQPIDNSNTETAKQRNRRIELKLTQRVVPES
ncbi:OmpA family protein [Alphaproteobacteria bacterium]|nr:OmpA family protein [Alphaproteobacteria bacterium]